jgi:diguanylate cyclase (GGDEF)-like protein
LRLEELHRLATRYYESFDQAAAAYIKAGCELLSADSGSIQPSAPEESVINAAIFVEQDIIGYLSFSSTPVNTINPDDQAFVELMAASLARFAAEDRIRSERRAIERLDRDRNTILQMVAENRPVRDTLKELEQLVERQCPGCRCAVAIEPGSTPNQVFGVPPAHEQAILSATGAPLGKLILYSHQPPRTTSILPIAARIATIAIEQRQLTDRLVYHAQHDFLTGLPNRFHLMELLERCLAQSHGIVAVLFIDLDRFKQINDSLGHSAGDRFLIEAAERLKACLQSKNDIAARMGGDEFTAVLTEAADETGVLRAARHFLDALRAPYLIDGHELIVTASIGVSLFPKHGQDASSLLRAADAAMYRAKKDGANAISRFVANPCDGAMERLDLENALRRALEKSEFELFFQPITTLNGELTGLEVLLSWNHATRGRIPPGQFIPMAEQTGLIVPIGSWVLQQACKHAAAWVNDGFGTFRISVNVSALQFARSNFVEIVADALGASGLPSQLLELELTETLVLSDISESIHRMAQLKQLGVAIAIDDFGTGYSSLNYLRRLPLDTLKIDRSFLRDLRTGSGTLQVVETIVSLAHQMGLNVVAEGVETEEQLNLLRETGCDRVQGHLFGQPVRSEAVRDLLSHATSDSG